MFQKPVSMHYIENNSTDMLVSLFALALLSHHTNQQLWVRPLLSHAWPGDSFGISCIHVAMAHHYSLVRDQWTNHLCSLFFTQRKGCAIYSKFLWLSIRFFAITTGICILYSVLWTSIRVWIWPTPKAHEFEYGPQT